MTQSNSPLILGFLGSNLKLEISRNGKIKICYKFIYIVN